MLQEVYWISSHVDVRTLYAAPRLDRNQIEKHGVFRLQRRVTDSAKQEEAQEKKEKKAEPMSLYKRRKWSVGYILYILRALSDSPS
jgi:hypothetical protein